MALQPFSAAVPCQGKFWPIKRRKKCKKKEKKERKKREKKRKKKLSSGQIEAYLVLK
jgi:hypothetical protein